eukprot:10984824-Karenia_brevis.AAC.1
MQHHLRLLLHCHLLRRRHNIRHHTCLHPRFRCHPIFLSQDLLLQASNLICASRPRSTGLSAAAPEKYPHKRTLCQHASDRSATRPPPK